MFYPAGVSANPPKNDAWPDYPAPEFVLIQQPGKQRPVRGLIVGWRGAEGKRQALVVYNAEGTPTRPRMVCQEWIWQQHLTPVFVDPNYREGRYV